MRDDGMRRGRNQVSGGACVPSKLGAEHDQISIPFLGHVENLFGSVAELHRELRFTPSFGIRGYDFVQATHPILQDHLRVGRRFKVFFIHYIQQREPRPKLLR